MHQVLNIKHRVNIVTLLTLLPILLLAILILGNSVNVPLLDQWEMVPIIEHIRAGHFIWTDFWWQHNEHRILIPNIILAIMAMVTHWNTVAELFIGFFVSILSFWVLVKMLRDSSATLKRKLPVWLPVTLSVIWFSPVQIENWLWGWQVEWFLNVLGTMLVFYALTKTKNRDISHAGLLLILGGGILAQYSLGNGTLLWPLAVVVLAYARVPIFKSAIVAGTGLVTTALYYHHYINPTYPSKTLFIKEPVTYIRYVLIYLGRPLTFLHTGAVVMGGCLLAVFVALNAYLFVRKRVVFNKLVSWTGLGLYAVASAGITGISRVGLGLSEAYSSRYTTISMLILISVVVSLTFASKELAGLLRPAVPRLLLAGMISSVALLLLTNVAWGVHSASVHKKELLAIKQCTSVVVPSQSCLLSTYPNADIVKGRLDYLKQIHWGGY